jgi:GMP synthase-like glutamine amidotransferase
MLKMPTERHLDLVNELLGSADPISGYCLGIATYAHSRGGKVSERQMRELAACISISQGAALAAKFWGRRLFDNPRAGRMKRAHQT